MVVALNAIAAPGYLTIQNQINLFTLGVEKAIVVLVMTFVIISGEIDLSVASVMGLAAVIVAYAVEPGHPDRSRDRRGARWSAPLCGLPQRVLDRDGRACRRWRSRSPA